MNKKLEELKNQLEEIKKQIEELEKPKKEIWKPEFCEHYWYIVASGRVVDAWYDEVDFDPEVFDCGNFFKTEAEAEHQANVQKYTNLYRKYVEEHSEPLDWNNVNQCKCYAYYTHYDEIIDFYTEHHKKLQGVIYASERKILEEAIEFVGVENFIKYVIGVKNEK